VDTIHNFYYCLAIESVLTRLTIDLTCQRSGHKMKLSKLNGATSTVLWLCVQNITPNKVMFAAAQIPFCTPPAGCRCGPADEVICDGPTPNTAPSPTPNTTNPFPRPGGLKGFPSGGGGGGRPPSFPSGKGGFVIPGKNPTLGPPDANGNRTCIGCPVTAPACCLAAVGRPFRDGKGDDIVAEVRMTGDAIIDAENDAMYTFSSWVYPEAIRTRSLANSEDQEHTFRGSGNQEIVDDWAHRAAGEHSSIASFAAFAIALLTNEGPPDLIRDSLQAAIDELNHATASFTMASELAGQTYYPGSLPSTSLSFSSDLIGLVQSTISEGCIGETLSALQMASQMENQSSKSNGVAEHETRLIAWEEAQHAALAWRTIAWACRKNALACDTARPLLRDAITAADTYSQHVELHWKMLLQTLVPLVLDQRNELNDLSQVRYKCDSSVGRTQVPNFPSQESFAALMVESIFTQVYCSLTLSNFSTNS
jgi:hypothetical protein